MLIFAAAVIASLSPVPQRDAEAGRIIAPVCQNFGPHKVGLGLEGVPFERKAVADKPGAHPLVQEPAADAIAAVLYSEGGCSRPVVVSQAMGALRKEK